MQNSFNTTECGKYYIVSCLVERHLSGKPLMGDFILVMLGKFRILAAGIMSLLIFRTALTVVEGTKELVKYGDLRNP